MSRETATYNSLLTLAGRTTHALGFTLLYFTKGQPGQRERARCACRLPV